MSNFHDSLPHRKRFPYLQCNLADNNRNDTNKLSGINWPTSDPFYFAQTLFNEISRRERTMISTRRAGQILHASPSPRSCANVHRVSPSELNCRNEIIICGNMWTIYALGDTYYILQSELSSVQFPFCKRSLIVYISPSRSPSCGYNYFYYSNLLWSLREKRERRPILDHHFVQLISCLFTGEPRGISFVSISRREGNHRCCYRIVSLSGLRGNGTKSFDR